VPFGRRTPTASNDVPEPVDEQHDEGSAHSETKGRPTPKRSEARKARRNPSPGSRSKTTTPVDRDRARADRQKVREALRTGDERNLPSRDAGPERRLARDVVDSRFTYGQIFIFVVAVVFFLGTFITNETVRSAANIAGLASLAIIGLDSGRHGRAARQAVTEKYGADRARGLATYAFTRAMLPRRFRRPPPKVKRGEKVG
jgi:hypothetical protein